MKSSLSLIVVFGIFLASQAYQETEFRSKHEYIYHYDTQVTSRLGPDSPTVTGLRLSAQTRVVMVTHTKVHIQLDEVFLYRIDRPLFGQHTEPQMLSEESLPELVGPQAETMVRLLQIPFGFLYNKGRVGRIIFSDEETKWSGDVKRGLISLFEVNLDRRMMFREKSRARHDADFDSGIDTYKVMEKSPSGTCATLYTVKPKLTGKHLYVSKFRDFEKCLERPGFSQTIIDGYWTQESEKIKPLTQASSVQYSLSGTKDRFLILSVVGEMKLTLSPGGLAEDVQTVVNQTLYLKSTKRIGSYKAVPKVKQGKMKHVDLHMATIERLAASHDPFHRHEQKLRGMQMEQEYNIYPIDMIYAEMSQAAAVTPTVESPNSLVHLRMLVKMLRSSREETIESLWKRASADENTMIKTTLWNLLSRIGTEAATKVVLSVCRSDMSMNEQCVHSLNQLTLNSQPTHDVIKYLIRMVDEGNNKISDKLQQAVFLTLGSFSYKLSLAKHYILDEIEKSLAILHSIKRERNSVVRRFLSKKKREYKNKKNNILNEHAVTVHSIFKILKIKLENGTVEDKILGLKALGNAGDMESVTTLKSIAEDYSEPMLVRILAIKAHRRLYLTEAGRQQAMTTLLRIYENPKEIHEIRTTAFNTLMGLWPDETIVQSIAHSLYQEKDAQVTQHVLTYMESLANSSYTAIWKMSKASRDALKFAPSQEDINVFKSFSKSFGMMNANDTLGINIRFSKLGTSSRYEGWKTGVETYIYGLHSSLLEIGVDSEGLSSIVEKLWGPKGLLALNKSMFDLFKRSKRSTSQQDVIDNIFKTLNIKTRSSPLPTTQIYHQVMGHELGYTDISSYLRGVTQKGKTSISLDIDKMRAGLSFNQADLWMLHDNQLTLPSESGLPISLKFQVSAAYKARGSFSARIEPNFFESDRVGKKPLAAVANLKIDPRIATELYGSMGLDSHFVESTVAFRATFKHNMPFSSNMTINLSNGKYVIANEIPKMTKPTCEAVMEPIAETNLLSVSNKAPILQVDTVPITTRKGVSVIALNLNYSLHNFGFSLNALGQMSRNNRLSLPTNPLTGRSAVSIFLQPLKDQPVKVVKVFGQLMFPSHGPATDAQLPRKYLGNQVPDDDLKNPDLQKQLLEKWAEKQWWLFVTSYRHNHIKKTKDTKNNQHIYSQQDEQSYSDQSYLFRDDVPYMHRSSNASRSDLKPDTWAGLVVFVDAGDEDVPRLSRTSLIWSDMYNAMTSIFALNVNRVPVPGYDKLYWKLSSHFVVVYPQVHHRPDDILSVEWQQQMMKELQSQIALNSNKVANEDLKRTLMTLLGQLNHNGMTRLAASNIIERLIPQVLLTIKSHNTSNTSPTNWHQYFDVLGDLSSRVEAEAKLVLDPAFINRDAILISYLVDLLSTQRGLLKDLEGISYSGIVAHAELPLMQYVMLLQQRVVYNLERIFNRNEVKHGIAKTKYILQQLRQSKDFLDMSTRVTNKIISKCFEATQMHETELQKVSAKMNHPGPSSGDGKHHQNPVVKDDKEYSAEDSIKFLSDLAIFQMKVIEEAQLALSQQEEIEPALIFRLVHTTRETMNNFDNLWTEKPIMLDATLNTLLMVIIQNEILIDVLHQYRTQGGADSSTQDVPVNVNHELSDTFETYLLKCEGYYLGQRTASSFKYKMQQDVLNPTISDAESTIYNKIQMIHRRIATVMRHLELKFVYNTTAMRNHIVAAAVLRNFTDNIDVFLSQIASSEQTLFDTESSPNVYIIIEIMETVNYLKFVLDAANTAILPLPDSQRTAWTEKLEQQIASAEELLASLSSIFKRPSTTTSYYDSGQQAKGERPLKNDKTTWHPDNNQVDTLDTGLNPEIESIKSMFEMSWGSYEHTDSFTIKISAQRSAEQLLWLFQQMDAAVRDPDMADALSKNLGSKNISARSAAVDGLNKYNHLHLSTKLNKTTLPIWVRQYFSRFHDYVKASLWSKYSWQQPLPDTREGENHVILDISDRNKKWSMRLLTNEESNIFTDVSLPGWIKYLSLNQNSKGFVEQLMTRVTHPPAQCIIERNRVKTMDNVGFHIQDEISKCSTLLAMDCSDEKSFAITLIKSNSSQTLRIISEDQVLELQPSPASVGVKLNGQELQLSDNQPFKLHRELFYNKKSTFMTITRENTKVEVELPLVGLYVATKGDSVDIQASDFYRNKICGLCGNFDSQRTWEFEGPRREVYTSPISFVSTYVLPGGPDCRIDPAQTAKTAEAATKASEEFVPGFPYDFTFMLKEKKLNDGDSKHTNSDGEADTKTPATDDKDKGWKQSDNQHNEKDVNTPLLVAPDAETEIRVRPKRRQVCFSRSPSYKCPLDSEPEKQVVVKMTYVCLPANDPRVELHRELASLGPIPKETLEKLNAKTFTRRVRQEVTCRSNQKTKRG